MAKERLPFELAKPDANTYVTQSSEIGHNGKPLASAFSGIEEEFDTLSEEVEGLASRTLEVKVVSKNGAKYLNISMGTSAPIQNNKSAVLGKAICGYAICGTN